MTKRVKIAAVQPALELGRVEKNLERVEDLVRDAYRVHCPDLIVLPEAVTSPNVYHPDICAVPRPVDGPLLTLFRYLAEELDCVIAGGGLCVRGRHAYGTYMLVEPDGRAHLHDKDIPSGTENFFNKGGDDDGITAVVAWGRRRVGLASGMEWTRTRTATRLRRAGVEIVIGGQCWPWTAVNWRGPIGRWSRGEYRRSIDLCRDTPPTMARLVGAPAVMASHVGDITMDTPFFPWASWRSPMVGETHICDRDGTTLARLSLADGEGHIAAQVELSPPQPVDELPSGYWTIDLGQPLTAMFHGSNAVGVAAYTLRSLRHRFPWQDGLGTDLPDEVPPRAAPVAAAGRRVVLAANACTAVTVRSRRQIADGVVHLTLASADGTALPPWKPGAHIDLVLADDLLRQYSLCGEPSAATYEVAVLREDPGTGGSAFVHDHVREGDQLSIRGPRNHFELDRTPGESEYLFIAGGIGITPLRPMTYEVAARGRPWRLVYGGRSASSMAFAEELERSFPDHVELHPQDRDGLLDLDAILAATSRDALVYCCGPESLLAAVESRCAGGSRRLRVERFLAKVSDSGPAEAFDIVLARSGRTLRVPAHSSMLDVLLDAGLDVDHSCQNGVCGSCELRVLGGEPAHRDSILTSQNSCVTDRVMACVSRSRGPTLTLDL
jgi:ferredoxin-NADP reductase/predicted amidohydrolase